MFQKNHANIYTKIFINGSNGYSSTSEIIPGAVQKDKVKIAIYRMHQKNGPLFARSCGGVDLRFWSYRITWDKNLICCITSKIPLVFRTISFFCSSFSRAIVLSSRWPEQNAFAIHKEPVLLDVTLNENEASPLLSCFLIPTALLYCILMTIWRRNFSDVCPK